MSNKPIKLLIVDDSKIIQRLMRSIYSSSPEFHIIGVANDGREAIRLTKKLKPDIISMDIMMPNMTGLEATETIMKECPTPIVIVSALITDDESLYSAKALAAGALAAFEKPMGIQPDEFEIRKKNLLDTMRTLARSHISYSTTSKTRKPQAPARPTQLDLLALGLSTGGPEALQIIIPTLKSPYPIPILIVLHLSKGFLPGLITWLQAITSLSVCIAEEQQALMPNTIYFAPDNCHLSVVRGEKPMVRLNDHPPKNGFKPSISELFHSLAEQYPKTAVGGLLTGMGKDGADGLAAMHDAGSYTFIQSPETAVIPSMPLAVKEIGAFSAEIDLDEMAEFLNNLVQARRT